MKTGITRVLAFAAMVCGASLMSLPALARCRPDCKRLIKDEFKACRAGCAKGDRTCKMACSEKREAGAGACRHATNPTPPDCGESTTTTTTTTTTTITTTSTTPPCHFDSGSNSCQGGCPQAGTQCSLVAPDQCDCQLPGCHTCWVTVSDSCTDIPCSSEADCRTQPNTLCLADKCQVPCPTTTTSTTTTLP